MIGHINEPSTRQIMAVDGTLLDAIVGTDNIVDGNVTMSKLADDLQVRLRSAANPYSLLPPPATFAATGWTPLALYQDASGAPSLGDVSLLDFAPTGSGVWYVDIARPDNTGDGLTWATAKRGINYAIQLANASADGGTIWVADGVYAYGDGFWTLDPTRNVAVRALNPGQVVFSNHRNYTFALDGVYTDTYTVAHGIGSAAHYEVRDALYVDALGDYQQLTKQTSAASVDANAGSWYDDGTTLWVRLSDDRAPDANLRPYWNAAGATPITLDAGSPTVLLDGIRVEGGSSCVTVQAASGAAWPTVYLYGCTFKYAYANGLNSVGADTYCQNCLAAKCVADGFHYAEKATAVRQARFLEFNCVGRDNGNTATAISNGSTSHNASVGIRLACQYFGNYGRNLHDVGSGRSWVVGCWSHDSASATADCDIACGTGSGDSHLMWIDHCRTGGSANDLEVALNCTIYKRWCSLGAGATTGAGTITSY